MASLPYIINIPNHVFENLKNGNITHFATINAGREAKIRINETIMFCNQHSEHYLVYIGNISRFNSIAEAFSAIPFSRFYPGIRDLNFAIGLFNKVTAKKQEKFKTTNIVAFELKPSPNKIDPGIVFELKNKKTDQ